MTNAEAIRVLLNEWKCIDRNDGVHCDRKCESCDLVMDSEVLKDAYNLAIKALEAQEWIPCSERLPDGKGYVLVTDYGETNIGRRFCGKWWLDYCGDKMKDVTAWMPLPEPYREEDINVNVKS